MAVSVEGCEPRCSRTLLVPEDLTLRELSAALDIAFDWWAGLERGFSAGGVAVPMSEKVRSLAGDGIVYTYGPWRHVIVPEGREDRALPFPEVVAFEGRSPPEGCDGPAEYSSLLRVLSDPSDPRYGEMSALASEAGFRDFDPDHTNEDLQFVRSGMFSGRLRSERHHGHLRAAALQQGDQILRPKPDRGGVVVGVDAYHAVPLQEPRVEEHLDPVLRVVQQAERGDRAGEQPQDRLQVAIGREGQGAGAVGAPKLLQIHPPRPVDGYEIVGALLVVADEQVLRVAAGMRQLHAGQVLHVPHRLVLRGLEGDALGFQEAVDSLLVQCHGLESTSRRKTDVPGRLQAQTCIRTAGIIA